jgi:hypothetical protein
MAVEYEQQFHNKQNLKSEETTIIGNQHETDVDEITTNETSQIVTNQ